MTLVISNVLKTEVNKAQVKTDSHCFKTKTNVRTLKLRFQDQDLTLEKYITNKAPCKIQLNH